MQVPQVPKRWPFLSFFMKINRFTAIVNDMPHLFMGLERIDSEENRYREGE